MELPLKVEVAIERDEALSMRTMSCTRLLMTRRLRDEFLGMARF